MHIRRLFYDHCRNFATPEYLLNLESKCLLEARADEIEVDNVLTEANNANIRRDCARAAQQRKLTLDEISARWLLRGEGKTEASMWCDECPDEKESSEAVRRAGGGGTCRAFLSRFSKLPEYKHDDGRVNWQKLHAQYKIELESPDSELMLACIEEGRRATVASHQIWQQTEERGGRRGSLSAFGYLHNARSSANASASQGNVKALDWMVQQAKLPWQPGNDVLAGISGEAMQSN